LQNDLQEKTGLPAACQHKGPRKKHQEAFFTAKKLVRHRMEVPGVVYSQKPRKGRLKRSRSTGLEARLKNLKKGKEVRKRGEFPPGKKKLETISADNSP